MCRRHNALHGKARTAPCTCDPNACAWHSAPKQVELPTEAEQLSTTAAFSGKAIAIGGEACDALELAVGKAKGEGRFQFASRLRALQGAIRKAAIEDVDREVAEKAERLEQIATEGEVLFKLELAGVYTKCEANGRGHWATRSEGISDLRPTIEMAIRAHASVKRFKPPFPCAVQMTRLAPPANRLDRGDNLESALKKVRDGIADWMRVNDRSHVVDWLPSKQEDARGFGVRIEIVSSAGGGK